MGFSRQEYWSGLPFPSPEIFAPQELNPSLLHCRQILYDLSHQGSVLAHTQRIGTFQVKISGKSEKRLSSLIVAVSHLWEWLALTPWTLSLFCLNCDSSQEISLSFLSSERVVNMIKNGKYLREIMYGGRKWVLNWKRRELPSGRPSSIPNPRRRRAWLDFFQRNERVLWIYLQVSLNSKTTH